MTYRLPHLVSLTSLSIIGALLISGVAAGHDQAAGQTGGGTTVAQADAKTGAEMKMMDGNHDGTVSASEHAAGAKKMFEMMDANRDGNVTAAEMDASRDKMGMKSAKSELSSADKIKVVDTDTDGVLSAPEHAAGSERMFAKMDTDKDGRLTAAEIQAGHDKLMSAQQH